MKVLYFHQHFTTPAGSAGTRSFEMAKALIQRGHEVTMVCGSNATGDTGLDSTFVRSRRSGSVDGIEVIEFQLEYSNKDRFIKRGWTFLKFAWRGVQVALKTDCDLVFATSTPLTASIPGIAAAWLRGKPFVFEVRDLWPELPKAMGVITNPVVLDAMALLEKVSYRSAKRCIGLAPGIVEGIAKHIDGSRVALIPNGCDLDLFSPSVGARWRPPSVSETDFLAVFAGTHGRANGLDAILDVAAVLKRMNRGDIKLLLVGGGGLKPKLMERAQHEQLENVVFHDSVSKYQIADLLRASDAGLQILADVPAFYYGTSPNKFFDYIAAGLPVITNYPGWVASLINDHRCGFAVPANDAEAFAQALVKLADTPRERSAMGAAARQLAESQFSRLLLAERFVAELEATLK